MLPDRYLRPSEAAAFLGVSRRTLGDLRRAGEGPPHVRLKKGGQARYLQSALAAWASRGVWTGAAASPSVEAPAAIEAAG